MDQRKIVLDFISQQKYAVIASVSPDGNPQDAVMGFANNDQFEIILGTSNLSRKYANFQHNPHVALVIGWDDGKTVQYEGTTTDLVGEELNIFKELYFAKNPHVKKYENKPDQIYIKVTPKWIRYTNLTQEPWEIIEFVV